MAKVPFHDIPGEELSPTRINPNTAATLGGEIVDLGQGIEGIGEQLDKMQTTRQVLTAKNMIAKQRLSNYQKASTDPDLDNVLKSITDDNEKTIDTAAQTIKDPIAREKFVGEAGLDTDRQMIPIQNIVYRRTSQDVKKQFNDNIENDLQAYKNSGDPQERDLLKNKMMQTANDLGSSGHINAAWASERVKTGLAAANIEQIRQDMGMPGMVENVAKELQKGDDGIYKDVPDSTRQKFFNEATQMIKKNGAEDKMIFAVAQNRTEGLMLNKFSDNTMTMKDIVDARAGKFGAPITKEFSQAAIAALQEPFPGESNESTYNALAQEVASTQDPLATKMKVLQAQGLTPKQKADLLNPINESSPNLDKMIKDGITKNRQAILEENLKIQNEMKFKQSQLAKAFRLFNGYDGSDKKVAQMTQDLMNRVSQQKDATKAQAIPEGQDSALKIAQQMINEDVLKTYPQVSNFPKEGKVVNDKYGVSIRIYPNGSYDVEGQQ